MTDYVLVYLARRAFPGAHWFERTNDPELRAWPMTYGICRGSLRKAVRNGDRLFFFGHDHDGVLDKGYYLTAYFEVDEMISQVDAARRFPGRPNVLLEELPNSGEARALVARYVERHARELRWPGKTSISG